MIGQLRRHAIAWLLCAVVVTCLFSCVVLSVRGSDDVSSSVGDADVAVHRAFNATLSAEEAGANVSGLLGRLNDAGALLGEAETAFSDGNLSEASSYASRCISIAQGVQSDADNLRASALDDAHVVFWEFLVFSSVSVAVFVVVLVLVWRRFKAGYDKNVLGMKPEVVT
jgi:hypothetical protein